MLEECWHATLAWAGYTMRLTMVTVLFSIVIFSSFRGCLSAEPSPPVAYLNTTELVAQMQAMDGARARSLKSYSSARRYTLENARFGTFAEIRVAMSYMQPGKKSFEILSELG